MSTAFPASPRAVSRRSVSVISAHTSDILRSDALTAVARIAFDGIKMSSLRDTGWQPGKACPAERPSPPTQAVTGVLGESGSGDAWRASAILARAQRREVCPNIWASRRSDSGLPACTLSR
jgi:hypothetical protein